MLDWWYFVLMFERHTRMNSAKLEASGLPAPLFATRQNTLYSNPKCSFGSFFYRFVYGCMFCILLFNSVSYAFLLLCLCILIHKYALFSILFANWHSPATLTEFFRAFSSVVRQMPGYTSQRRGTVLTLPNYWIVLFYLLFVSIGLFYVLFVCKCVLYYCHRVSTQIYHIKNISRYQPSKLQISHFKGKLNAWHDNWTQDGPISHCQHLNCSRVKRTIISELTQWRHTCL